MSKDYMTGGAASWITFTNPAGEKPMETLNPWEGPWGRDDQFAPIIDRDGLALFRRVFTVSNVLSARIDVTALGVFDVWCNGRRVGRVDENGNEVYDELKPGWTDYRKRVLYFSYDLTPYLVEGENVLFAMVAPGWYHGRIGLRTYGESKVAFMCAVKLHDASGERTIYSDTDWDAAWGGPIRAADIWDGELCDANFPSFKALSSGEELVAWSTPETVVHDELFVTPHVGPTIMVRPEMSRKPVSVTVYEGTVDNGSDFGKINVVNYVENGDAFALKKGQAAVIDLGQNMVGWPTFTVKGAAGTSIKIRVGEMLNDSGLASRGNDNPEGSIYSVNYRSAKAKAGYTLCGAAEGEYYCPTFTFFGFRYCEITATEDVEFLGFTALVVGSATREIGKIQTSHADVNQLISNILWGQRGNYLSVPTDCPQRDERLGWTGDTQAFCCTAAYNADVAGFFHKWLQDVRDSQADHGPYSDVVPRVRVIGDGNAAWGDAGIVVPYTMWKMYNDTSIIEEHYASMELYMDWLSTTGWNGPNPGYGDWLAYEWTNPQYISTTYYAMDALYMERMSEAIGRTDRAAAYREVYKKVREHYQEVFCGEDGMLHPEFRTQTGYLLALRLNLLEEDKREAAKEALKQKIIDNGYKLSTGFVGSCIINDTLSELGENGLAYSLLLQTDNPSWLYSVHQGATTIWERWNSYTKATGFGDVGMNSFNHYAYGAVAEWMYRHMAGIETSYENPGFAHVILQPKPDLRTPDEIPAGQEKITWVKASYDSHSGMIVSNWDMQNGFTYEATVPVAATLTLPVLTDADTFTVNGVTRRFDEFERVEGGVVMALEAGSYTFHQA